jgi:hypothetical protein
VILFTKFMAHISMRSQTCSLILKTISNARHHPPSPILHNRQDIIHPALYVTICGHICLYGVTFYVTFVNSSYSYF